MKDAKTPTSAKELSLFDSSGKEVEKFKLPKVLSDAKVNSELLHTVVLMYQTNSKTKLGSVKNRGEVSGGGIKPWRQKGTGRARVGSTRNPIWRKGGSVFGPIPRDSHYSLPQKMRSQALKSSIIDKLNEDRILVLEKLKIEKPKTKLLYTVLQSLKIKEKALLILAEPDEAIFLAARNLAHLEVKLASDVNAFDVLRFRKLIVLKPAFEQLVTRMK